MVARGAFLQMLVTPPPNSCKRNKPEHDVISFLLEDKHDNAILTCSIKNSNSKNTLLRTQLYPVLFLSSRLGAMALT